MTRKIEVKKIMGKGAYIDIHITNDIFNLLK